MPAADIRLDEIIARLLSLKDQDIIRLYNGLSIKHRDRKAEGKAKKSAVQTRTESFQTAIDGEDITPHRRGEKRKVPKTPARRRQRVDPSQAWATKMSTISTKFPQTTQS